MIARQPPRAISQAADLDTVPRELPANEALERSGAVPVAAKPLLASEALMDDLAPMEPARRDARTWCLAVGGSFVALGALPLFGARPGGPDAAIPWLVTGLVSLVAGLSRVGYRQRAVAMVVTGVLSGVLGFHGPSVSLARAAGSMGWALVHLFTAVALAAALLFRGRYRAYAGARVFLGVALGLSLPFVVHAAAGLTSGFGLAQVGAVMALCAVATSLIGFMGAETTVAGPYVASGVVTVFALDLLFEALGLPGVRLTPTRVIEVITAALGFAGSAALAAVGIFQIVAWRFAADARRIDIHSPPEEPATSSRDPSSDWSTRD